MQMLKIAFDEKMVKMMEQAAAIRGISLPEFIRDVCKEEAEIIIDNWNVEMSQT